MTMGLGQGQEDDALTAAHFELQIDRVQAKSKFSELAGISSSLDVVDFLESGGDKGTILKKLPGKRNPPTVTLRRGMTKNVEMDAWHQLAVEGNVPLARRTCTLTMFNTGGDPVAKYTLEDAWPSRVEIGALKAGATEVLIETVTIVCEHIRREG
jgi:phage tail-like protein